MVWSLATECTIQYEIVFVLDDKPPTLNCSSVMVDWRWCGSVSVETGL